MSDVAYGLIVLTVIGGIFAGTVWLCGWVLPGMMQYGCDQRWGDKYQPEWRLAVGCTIIVNGERIPESNYRVL